MVQISLQPFFPESIFDFLAEKAVSHFMDKFLWTLDPTTLVDWLNDWLEFDETVVPFARTAFGDIFFVRDQRVMVLLSSRSLLDYTTSKEDLFFDHYLTDEKYLEEFFNLDLFRQLDTRFDLAPDECFGFSPLLSRGGEMKRENLRRTQLKDYLSSVSEASEGLTYYPY